MSIKEDCENVAEGFEVVRCLIEVLRFAMHPANEWIIYNTNTAEMAAYRQFDAIEEALDATEEAWRAKYVLPSTSDLKRPSMPVRLLLEDLIAELEQTDRSRLPRVLDAIESELRAARAAKAEATTEGPEATR